ncbi:MAG TPA: HAD family hydrolase [Syntrophobacteraceae bacterium]|nr:HAD family hydrolase [Syntrophobacteraceae bacterium]
MADASIKMVDRLNGAGDVVWLGRRIDGIVFDVDGTLTDSIEAYYEIFRETCSRFGIQVARKDVLEPMVQGSNIWDRIIPHDLPDREEKLKQCNQAVGQVFLDVMRRTQPFPGLEEVLLHLRQNGLRLGIFTASWRPALLPMKESGLINHFAAVVTREDGYAVKPAPDGISACLRLMKVEPAHALSVGDSPLDIRAGKEAGTLTVGVLSGIATREQLEAEAPASIIEGVGQLTAVLGLP